MSLQEKSAQTISEEITLLKERVNINRSRIQMFEKMLSEMKISVGQDLFDIEERETQLELRAKAKR